MANTAKSKQFLNVSASKKFENFVRVIFSPHVAGDIFYTVIQAMDLTRLTRIAKTQQKHMAVLLKHSVKLCFLSAKWLKDSAACSKTNMRPSLCERQFLKTCSIWSTIYILKSNCITFFKKMVAATPSGTKPHLPKSNYLNIWLNYRKWLIKRQGWIKRLVRISILSWMEGGFLISAQNLDISTGGKL